MVDDARPNASLPAFALRGIDNPLERGLPPVVANDAVLAGDAARGDRCVPRGRYRDRIRIAAILKPCSLLTDPAESAFAEQFLPAGQIILRTFDRRRV